MCEFKIGDRVRYMGGLNNYYREWVGYNVVGKSGRVIDYFQQENGSFQVDVMLDEFPGFCQTVHPSNLELIKRNNHA